MQSELNYTILGEGEPFVFQHGLGSDLNQPQNLLGELQGIRLISMDCPGHGASALDDVPPPSFQYYADRLLHLLNELAVERAIFGGISMGSGIALNIALRFPEKVKGLVLVRPAWLDSSSPENLSILLEAAQWIGKENGKTHFEQNADFQKIQKLLPKAAASILGVFAPTQRAEIPLVLEKMVNDRPFTSLEALTKIKQPCLIIGNENDPLHPFEMAEKIHQYIAGSELIKVPSRYKNDIEHRKVINRIVSKYINDL